MAVLLESFGCRGVLGSRGQTACKYQQHYQQQQSITTTKTTPPPPSTPTPTPNNNHYQHLHQQQHHHKLVYTNKHFTILGFKSDEHGDGHCVVESTITKLASEFQSMQGVVHTARVQHVVLPVLRGDHAQAIVALAATYPLLYLRGIPKGFITIVK